MSVGPSALGTLLVQRLDAALGTTLSQQANLVSGARPDAVTQPGQPERPEATRNETVRDGRTNVDRALEQSRQHGQQSIDRAKLDARAAALLASRGLVSTTATPSAPTSLGQAARAILALLANYPGQSPDIQGKTPLLNHKPGTAVGQQANTAAGAGAQRADAGAGTGRAAVSASTSGGAAAVAAQATGNALPSPGIAGQLTQVLAQIVQNSGMFYESHLNGLAFGKQTLAQLQQEPQAQAGRNTPNTPNNPAAPNSSTTSGPNTPGPSNNATQNAMAARAESGASTPSNSAATTSPTAHTPVPGVDPQTQMLVRQQLEVLANQTFAWRGEAWPDAPLEWEVSRHESPPQEQDGSENQTHWATKIKIQLPQLGTVQARLTLSGQQLVMHVIAPESAELLGEHTESLRNRCAGQGLQLSQLSIASDGPEQSRKETDHDDTATRA